MRHRATTEASAYRMKRDYKSQPDYAVYRALEERFEPAARPHPETPADDNRRKARAAAPHDANDNTADSLLLPLTALTISPDASGPGESSPFPSPAPATRRRRPPAELLAMSRMHPYEYFEHVYDTTPAPGLPRCIRWMQEERKKGWKARQRLYGAYEVAKRHLAATGGGAPLQRTPVWQTEDDGSSPMWPSNRVVGAAWAALTAVAHRREDEEWQEEYCDTATTTAGSSSNSTNPTTTIPQFGTNAPFAFDSAGEWSDNATTTNNTAQPTWVWRYVDLEADSWVREVFVRRICWWSDQWRRGVSGYGSTKRIKYSRLRLYDWE